MLGLWRIQVFADHLQLAGYWGWLGRFEIFSSSNEKKMAAFCQKYSEIFNFHWK